MTDKYRLDAYEFAAIERHLLRKIEHAKAAIAQIRSVPYRDRPDYMKKNLIYWNNVVGAYKWALDDARVALADGVGKNG